MKRSNLFLFSILFLMICLLPPEIEAIPAFARQYKISCNTCHAPIPKLKDFGEEFAGNGFVIPEEQNERDFITAGDDMLWLHRSLPVAVRFDAYGLMDSGKNTSSDFQTPWGLKFLSGGSVYKNIGYYFYFYLSERGEVAGIEDAYIHFNNLFGSELDIMVGQFQTSDPLMKRELRLTFEDYQIYKVQIGLSETNLAYDRGIMVTFGIPQTGTDLTAMLVNGNGKEAADNNQKFDKDKFKNAGFRINQGIGAAFSVGGFYYYGKESIGNPAGDHPLAVNNEITFWGPDMRITAGVLEFTGQFLSRNDSHPLVAGKDVRSDGIIAELIIAPEKDRSRFFITGLYNQIDSDLDFYDSETATVSATCLAARNLRLLAEITRDLKNDENRFVVGFVSAF